MTILQMAMAGNITWPQLREMIFAHPLYAESINNLFMQFD
jgi:pyruvate/2-oxoglutarate dehydrogenase complex dihydrolipoamide dehydrogenase (E3) component